MYNGGRYRSASFVLATPSPAFSSRLLFYAGLPFRMKKSVQISRIVSEIHINETRRFSLSGNALDPDPMLIPIPHPTPLATVFGKRTKRRIAGVAATRPVYSFVPRGNTTRQTNS